MVGRRVRRTTAVVGAGSADGIRPGMRFHVSQPAEVHEHAEVVAVEEKTCTVRFEEYLGAWERGNRPAVGWVLSTRHWIADMRAQEPRVAGEPNGTSNPPDPEP